MDVQTEEGSTPCPKSAAGIKVKEEPEEAHSDGIDIEAQVSVQVKKEEESCQAPGLDKKPPVTKEESNPSQQRFTVSQLLQKLNKEPEVSRNH